MKKQKTKESPVLRLDIGCGMNKKPHGPGEQPWYGIDSIAFPGVDKVVDITKAPWPFPDNSVEEFHCSHVIEHLTWPQRCLFFNELFRVLKIGGKGQLVLPHWASQRYYGDPTHQSPMSEFAFYYLSKKWRLDDKNAPHADIKYNPTGYNCNFEVTWGHSLHPSLQGRNQEYVQNALTFYKDAAQDLIANLVKVMPH